MSFTSLECSEFAEEYFDKAQTFRLVGKSALAGYCKREAEFWTDQAEKAERREHSGRLIRVDQ